MVFRGGCTLDPEPRRLNTVEYVILKNIKSYDRFADQAAYMNGEEPEGARRPRYRSMRTTIASGGCDFKLLHQCTETMSLKVSAKVCMYRLHELGDCFLVTFTAGAASRAGC